MTNGRGTRRQHTAEIKARVALASRKLPIKRNRIGSAKELPTTAAGAMPAAAQRAHPKSDAAQSGIGSTIQKKTTSDITASKR